MAKPSRLVTIDGDNCMDETADAAKVVIVAGGVLKEVRVTKTITVAGAYDLYDVISEDTTNATGTDWDFTAIARVNGGYGYITGATIVHQTPNITPALTLLLFNAAPTGEKDDNALNTSPVDADLAKFIGAIDFPALSPVGTSANSHATASPSTYGNLPLVFKCVTGSDDLFGILVTRSVFTGTAGDNVTIILTAEQY